MPTERSAVEILKAAKERISDRARWAQGWFARDSNGDRASAADPRAVCWCAVGAVYAEEELAASVADFQPGVVDFLIDAAKPKTVAKINDHDGHAAVLSLFDRAIELAEAR